MVERAKGGLLVAKLGQTSLAIFIVAVLTAGFLPAGAAPQADCDGTDSKEWQPQTLTPGRTCFAAHNNCDDKYDYYRFTATPDDGVKLTVSYNGANGIWISGGGYYYYRVPGYGPDGWSFVVPASGYGNTVTYTVEVGYTGNSYYYNDACTQCDDWSGYCYDIEQVYDYDIRVDVTANTRPYPYFIGTLPSFAIYGEPTPFPMYATDSDSNGQKVGASFTDRGTSIDWVTKPVWGYAAHTFSRNFTSSARVDIYAKDAIGAQDKVSHNLTVGENDCGLMRDVTVEARPMPFSCHATLWAPIADHGDAYTFDVAAGTERLYAGFSPFVSFAYSDARVKLTAPDGGVSEGVDASLFVPGPQEGSWRLDVDRLVGSGSYDLDVHGIGAAAPPQVVSALSPASPHQGETVTLSLTASDPNGLQSFFEIYWGDGVEERYPAIGTISNGSSVTRTHVYNTPVLDPELKIRSTNDEGLFEVLLTPVPVVWHHDCGFSTIGYDAPSSKAGPGLKTIPDSCVGDLGFNLPSGSVDSKDTYNFTVPNGDARTRTLTLTTFDGLDARVYVEWWFLGGGPFASLQSSGGDSETIEMPILPPGNYYVYVERLSGQGQYLLQYAADSPAPAQ
ncbi:MAG: hypothetical protein HY556_04330 [Euryarchaeota archaeon]|nr:hypothetical protein [Euryarchaeota archaeon]